MKVLYYVEKELAQFDPARRMRGRCEHLLVLCDLCFIQDLVTKDDMGVTIFEALSQHIRDTTTESASEYSEGNRPAGRKDGMITCGSCGVCQWGGPC